MFQPSVVLVTYSRVLKHLCVVGKLSTQSWPFVTSVYFVVAPRGRTTAVYR
jgi:hypothetical protein